MLAIFKITFLILHLLIHFSIKANAFTSTRHLLSVKTSYAGSKMDAWADNVKLILKTHERFDIISIDQNYSYRTGIMFGKTPIVFKSDLMSSKSIRCLRTIQFSGGSYEVLNILALPCVENNLPILGIDIVSLPG